jgi:hypothetical protein
MFFLLITFFGKSVITFFLFSNAIYIFSLIFKTLANGFCGFSFWCTNKYWNIFTNSNSDWHVSFLSPLLSLTYLYHWFSSLHRLLNIIYAQSTLCLSLLWIIK